ncbi:MAG: cold-shock protein [Phycisphaerales bacterium]|nr:cold-shock protein [Phycisphaerales bacterium]
MANGTVAKFFDDKGYGFITPEGGGKDVFVHFSDIEMEGRRTLHPGQQVTFEVSHEGKGPKASNVKIV